MRYVSPLRYPGGKASLSNFFTDIIDFNDLRGCDYYEPYAGGAGAALSLLKKNIVSRIILNDADFRVYAFWHTALHSTEQLAEKISTAPLSIDEWKRQNTICAHPAQFSMLEVGFATFYMNRCNRSGVLTGAGPIGGYNQSGGWGLDARFNREALISRIMDLKRLSPRIEIFNFDAVHFLKNKLPKGCARKKVFAYLDPPYVINGKRLYLNTYEAADHRNLSIYLKKQKVLPWIMSYDDNPLIIDLYSDLKISRLTIRYSLSEKRKAYELIVCPYHMAVPSFCRIGNSEIILKKVA